MIVLLDTVCRALRTIKINNLTRNVNIGHLEEIFGRIGPVSKVELGLDSKVIPLSSSIPWFTPRRYGLRFVTLHCYGIYML
jgi:hypothetical protein